MPTQLERTLQIYLLVMANVLRGGGRAPPPSPAWANFTLMMKCTPESSCCYSVYDRPCSRQAGALTTYLRLNIAPWYNLFCFFTVILSFLQALSLQPVFQNTNPSSTQVTDPCSLYTDPDPAFQKKIKNLQKKRKFWNCFIWPFFKNKVRFYLYSIRLPGIQMISGVHTVSSSANRVIKVI